MSTEHFVCVCPVNLPYASCISDPDLRMMKTTQEKMTYRSHYWSTLYAKYTPEERKALEKESIKLYKTGTAKNLTPEQIQVASEDSLYKQGAEVSACHHTLVTHLPFKNV